MSLRIVSNGVLTTMRDGGRFGYQSLGVNPGGAMDLMAARLANIIAGNQREMAVMEMHFPAPALLFEEDAIFSLAGADFGAMVGEIPIPGYTPVVIRKYTALEFKGQVNGAHCYLAVHGGFALEQWLGSYSTNLKAKAGGFNGRSLQLNDQLLLQEKADYRTILRTGDVQILKFQADTAPFYSAGNTIRITKGPEYNHLMATAKLKLITHKFTITSHSDSMGYRLQGEPLKHRNEEMISAAVVNGTIQLLPNGQLIILMADHQTTGGYPRIANVTSADLPTLAQMTANREIRFELVDQRVAEQLLLEQHQNLEKMENACALRWAAFLEKLRLPPI